jgi:hypothetical protein
VADGFRSCRSSSRTGGRPHGSAVRRCAQPRPAGDLVKVAIFRASQWLDIPFSGVRDIWYGARWIDADGKDQLRQAAKSAEFTRGDSTTRWSQPITKSWQYVKKVLKIVRADLTLYATRHLMADWLDNSTIAKRTRDRILWPRDRRTRRLRPQGINQCQSDGYDLSPRTRNCPADAGDPGSREGPG